MKKITALCLGVAAGAMALAAADPYKVTVPLGEDFDGAMAYLVNYDTGENVDSVLTEGGEALFKGMMDEPLAARVIVDGNRYSQFILEPGSISFDKQRRAFGSQLNDEYRAITDSVGSLVKQFQAASDSAARAGIYDNYMKLMDSRLRDNLDNPIGYMLFLELANEMEPAQLKAFLAEHPDMTRYRRVAKLQATMANREATQPGGKYVDFDIDGQKLSDYVGRDGHYLLVDFWASWCGPCMRQVPVIKELQQAYGDKGLDILGVAVWDKADDTRAAIGSHGITWPCIIDAGTVPTDLYGISGIPCIMLIGPDGTILSRDKQGDELKADVARYLENK